MKIATLIRSYNINIDTLEETELGITEGVTLEASVEEVAQYLQKEIKLGLDSPLYPHDDHFEITDNGDSTGTLIWHHQVLDIREGEYQRELAAFRLKAVLKQLEIIAKHFQKQTV